MKKISIPKNLLIPLLAVGVGTVAALGANRYIQQRIEAAKPRVVAEEMTPMVVAAVDLPKGTRLTQENLSVRPVPKAWVHSNAISPDQFDRVENAELAVPAHQGEPVLWAQLEGQRAASFSARLGMGRRAVTVPVDEISSISGMLTPGDNVDLIVTTRVNQRATMVPVMQSVKVLATGTRVGAGDAENNRERSFTTITLDVTPQEAKKIMAAREVGKLTALLRAPGDNAPIRMASSDALGELGLGPGTGGVNAAMVPVLYGAGDPRRYTVKREEAAAVVSKTPGSGVNNNVKD
jgi:pilus assembly protein CpaB